MTILKISLLLLCSFQMTSQPQKPPKMDQISKLERAQQDLISSIKCELVKMSHSRSYLQSLHNSYSWASDRENMLNNSISTSSTIETIKPSKSTKISENNDEKVRKCDKESKDAVSFCFVDFVSIWIAYFLMNCYLRKGL